MIKLIDLEVYKSAMEIGDRVWDIVNKWDFFNKENKNFNYYSCGSAFESTSCLRKALKRKLITEKDN